MTKQDALKSIITTMLGVWDDTEPSLVAMAKAGQHMMTMLEAGAMMASARRPLPTTK